MKNIHKVTLSFGLPQQFVELPENSKILSVQNQEGRLVLWYMFDEGAKLETVEFIIATTGNRVELPHTAEYLGTVQFYEGSYVVHVFKRN